MDLMQLVTKMVSAGVPEDEIGAFIRDYGDPGPGTPEGDRPMSTITSQPIPTEQETFKQHGEALRTVGPIAGDVGMAIATRGMSLPSTFLGRSIPQLAVRGGNVALRAMGSAAGAGLPAKVGDVFSGDDKDTATPAMAIGAGGELAMGAAGGAWKLGKRIGKPALDFFADVSEYGKSMSRKATTYLLNTQKKIREESASRAFNFLNDLAPEAARGKAADLVEIGTNVGEALSEAKVIYRGAAEALETYAKGNNGVVDLGETANYLSGLMKKSDDPAKALDAALAELGYTAKSKQAYVLKRIIDGGGEISPADVGFLQTNLFKGWKGLAPSQRTAREKLKASLLQDIDDVAAATGIPAGEMKREADQLYKAVKQFQSVQDIYKQALKTTESGRMYVMPYPLVRSIYAKKEQILRDMPELWPKLKAEADYFKEIAPKFERIEVDGAFDVFTAWSILMPETKKALETVLKTSKAAWSPVGKAATKGGLQMAGQYIDFGGE